MTNPLARALILGFLALLLLGCPQKAVKVGVILPLTGDDATYGNAVKNGLELAFEDIQADSARSTQLELVIVDSESDPQKAANLLETVYDDGALLAIGGVTSSEAKEMINVANRYDRVLISPSASSPELTAASSNFYRIFPSDYAAASKMAQFLGQDLKVDEVVVVAEEAQEFAKGIQGAFSTAYKDNYAGTVLEVVEYPPNTVEFSGLMQRVMTLDPKAVYLAAYGAEAGAMIQELRRLDYEGKILTTSAFSSPEFIAPVGDDAAGVFLTQSVFELDSDHAHIKTFVEKYQERHGKLPDIYAAHGYDVLGVVAAAVEGRPPIPSEAPKGLRDSIQDYPGVTGSIQFNEQGDVQKYPRIYVITQDLMLQDYNERVRSQQEELRKRREELKRKLDEINRQAQQIND